MSGLELNEDDYLRGDDDNTLLYMPKSVAIDVEYFTELTTGELNSLNNITIPTEALPRIDGRVVSINGLRLYDEYYYCDYCRSFPLDLRSSPLDLSSSYYCYDCNKDMCNLCFSETSAEIAEQNGAMNYHLRENDLMECRNHDLRRSIDRRRSCCDICEKEIPLMYPEHYYLEGEDYDICGACYIIGNNVRNKDDLIKIDGDIKFGSLYDWIEIFSDSDGNAVLCNLNPNSNYYKKSAFLAVDNHGRSGYYISDNMDISRLIDEYKENSQDETSHRNDVEDCCAIHSMMIKRHMHVYFG